MASLPEQGNAVRLSMADDEKLPPQWLRVELWHLAGKVEEDQRMRWKLYEAWCRSAVED